MLLLSVIAFTLGLESYVRATPIRRANTQNVVLYDGRVSSDFSAADLDDATSPYLAYVIHYVVPCNASTREIAAQ
jgi:hypothetical protein